MTSPALPMSDPYALLARVLPMTATLARFGDVPADFVEAEMAFERKLEELREWVASRKQGDRS